ncbi:hypothetical protein KFL_001600100 [Klebsormidium nitens]|uniref:Uncharacterized protein n=1 Tax=Klebsormidium nitens TaxID=105231 RepID=A0A1Y1HYK4_KLENI|nr:hypothetical protein KFL_001600100 [Klebsormidium nitens]|eukprot:GAQ83740.1 hypothetical protein KFL_001600100 [Klebsormidium nitens]
MSGRFVRQQRRKRWADTGIVFPPAFVARAALLARCDHPPIAAFAAQLSSFAALTSTYDEVARFKGIAALLLKAAKEIDSQEGTDGATNYSDLSEAVDLFLELLFFENSRPLHSHLLITAIRLPSLPPPPLPPPAGGSPATPKPLPQESERFSWLATRIARLCQEYSEGGPKARRFALVGVTSTLIGAQFQPLLAPVTKLSALVIARELCGYVAYATRHVMSAVMDECQEALSALFFLQREYGEQMLGPGANRVLSTAAGKNTAATEGAEARSGGYVSSGHVGAVQGEGRQAEGSQGAGTQARGTPGGVTLEGLGMASETGGDEGEGLKVYRAIVTTVLGVLQSGTLTRECDVAASVSLCGAVLLGSDPSDLALELTRAFLSEGEAVSFYGLDASLKSGENGATEVSSSSPAQPASSSRSVSRLPVNTLVLNPLNSDLRTEFRKCTEFGRLCILRSLLTTTPRPELNRPLLRQTPSTAADPGTLTPAKPWTLLYDGILPTLCRLCEDATDAHFKFHAITSLQVCLQQVKASLEESLAGVRSTGVDEGLERVSGEVVAANADSVEAGSREEDVKGVNGQSEESRSWETLLEGEANGLAVDREGEEVEGLTSLTLDGERAVGDVVAETGAEGYPLDGTSVENAGSDLTLKGTERSGGETIWEREGSRNDASGRASMLLTKEALDRVLQIVWNNWEDPLTQTVKQAQAVFDLLIEIHALYGGDTSFLENLARDLLAISPHRKGRYMPLAAIASRMGSTWLLERSPRIVRGVLEAMVNDSICCQAQSFLKAFLERLRSECWTAEGGAVAGDVAWRQHWAPDLLAVLLRSDQRLRAHLAAYVLPLVLSIDPDSLQPLLRSILSVSRERGSDRRTTPLESGDEEAVEKDRQSAQEALEGAEREQEGEGSLKRSDAATKTGGHLSAEAVPALIVTLKVARSLGIIVGGLDAFVEDRALFSGRPHESASGNANGDENRACGRLGSLRVPVSALEDAVCHAEESLRVSAAELVCLNPKSITMPCELELRLLRRAIPLNLRPSSTGFRNKWTNLMRKFFERVRASADHWSHQRELARKEQEGGRTEKYEGYKGSAKVKRAADRESTSAHKSDEDPEGAATLATLERFMTWLSRLLMSSLYPSAPYERKQMAMDLLGRLLEVWDPAAPPSRGGDVRWLWPYADDVTGREATLVLVGAVVDSWDRLREGAFGLLLKYPTPLPGLEQLGTIEPVLAWAKGLVYSPRVRESDAGSLVLRLVFRKYVVELGWGLQLHPEPKAIVPETQGPLDAAQRGAAIVRYLECLNDWLEAEVVLGNRDLPGACEHSLVHGVLLATRYTMEELDWRSDAVSAAAEGLRVSLKRLLGLILRVTALALWVVSVNALNLKELEKGPEHVEDLAEGVRKVQMYGNGGVDLAGRGGEGESESGGEESDGESEFSSDSEGEESDDDRSGGAQNGSGGAAYSKDEPQEFDDGSGMAPREQMVMVACWLSMKEVSLLLGTVTRRVPLGGGSEGGWTKAAFAEAPVGAAGNVLEAASESKGLSSSRTEGGERDDESVSKGEPKLEDQGLGSAAVTKNGGATFVKSDGGGEGLLDPEQLRQIGDHFVTVLLGMKHNGAIDKTQLGFVALCERMLKCGTPELTRLPEQWMERLMAKASSPGQGVDDLVRRSAGIPAAFLALFEAEPEGAPKRLLKKAMPWLLSWARGEPPGKTIPARRAAEDAAEMTPQGEEPSAEGPESERGEGSHPETGAKDTSGQKGELGGGEKVPEGDPPEGSEQAGKVVGGWQRVVKAALEGMVPQVHAFNTLRVAFGNTNLGTDTSGFAAEGLMVAVRGFASPHWEVRNAASLAYAALVLRMVGYLNLRQSERAHKKGISSLDFFNRYPTLHPFLLDELRAATWQLENPSTQRTTAVHPSLYPVLMLLARLRPSVLQTAQDDVNSPSAFIPFVMRCATQRNAHVRALASRALAPLVPAKDVLPLLKRLVSALPQTPPSTTDSCVSSSGLEPANPEPGSDELSPTSQDCSSHNAVRDGTSPETSPACGDFRGEATGSESANPASPSSSGEPASPETSNPSTNFLNPSPNPANLSSTPPNPSSNAAHGSLLQACALLSSVSQWTDEPARLSVLQEALPLIESRAWLGSPKRGCRSPLVAVAFLKLLDGLREGVVGLENGDELRNRVRDLLLELCREAGRLGGVDLAENGGGGNGISFGAAVAEADLREKAALLYFGCALSPESPLPGNAVAGRGSTGGGSFWGAVVESAPGDSSYEVRLAVLKSLKKFASGGVVGSGVVSPLESSFLLKAIVRRLAVEAHPKCVRRALRVFFLLSQAERNPVTGAKTGPGVSDGALGTSNTAEIEALWETVLSVYLTARQGKSKEAALCCLGACLNRLLQERRFPKQGLEGDSRQESHSSAGLQDVSESCATGAKVSQREALKTGGINAIGMGSATRVSANEVGFANGTSANEAGLAEKVALFLKLVKKHSRASEPVSFRSAAGDAVVASGLLKLAPAAAASLQPGESAKLPKGAAEEEREGDETWLVEAVLDAWFLTARLLEDEDEDLRDRLAVSMTHEVESAKSGLSSKSSKSQSPSQVEQTLVRTLDYLTELFGGWSESYLNRLAGWIYGPRGRHGLARIEGRDLVRRLFDKELDNHHEEDALFAQLASHHLRRILGGKRCESVPSRGCESAPPGKMLPQPGLGLRTGPNQAPKPPVTPVAFPEQPTATSEAENPARGPVGNGVVAFEGADGETELTTGPFEEVVRFWRGKFSDRLDTAVRVTLRLQETAAWVGGVTNHADAFALLYRALLGLLTFAPTSSNGADLQSRLREPLASAEVRFPGRENGEVGTAERAAESATRSGDTGERKTDELRKVRESLEVAARVLFGMALNPLVAQALLKAMAVFRVPLETVVSDGTDLARWQQTQAQEFDECFLMVARRRACHTPVCEAIDFENSL